ncbi:MAG TPA: hypothetical protein VNN79_03435, partial [Actinomycetota bacterium]|nr:hypothetical protein [Actinomycetota bacterium]
MTAARIWAAIDPTIRHDPDDLIDWEAADEASQRRHGEVATFWEQATGGVSYYRAWMPAKHLPGRVVRLQATRDLYKDSSGVVFRRQVGASVWPFPGNITRWLLMAEMHTQGIPVFAEMDDNYLVPSNTPGSHGWLIRRDPTPQDRPSFECHQAIIRSKAVDGLIVSTPKLADVYARLHANIHVCRNAVDPDDWAPDPPHQQDGILRIGWAGSASHKHDLNDVRPALDWASRQKDVQVVLFGELDMPGVRHRNIPWTEQLWKYRWGVRQVDVMLCPLRPSPWADCKSDVKALEAAMGGACSVVSRSEPFTPWWRDGAPSYSAATPK